MKKKYTLEQKIETWEKVIDKNAEHFRSRTLLSLQSSSLMVLIIGTLLGLITYSLIKSNNTTPTANLISGMVLLILAFIVSVWWLVANVLIMVIVSRVIKGANVQDQRKLIRAWIIAAFKRYPDRYLLPISDEEFKDQIEQLKSEKDREDTNDKNNQ
ncbi:hypothetical protein [Mycoplasma sp. HS2188]|uniref:hypothetical protein n=1 Tax=Mycoplasma sp. HS2188 TaxID=2976765 RepID=UPI0021AA95F6|nr:hypothetical protein [Mycoplasma sp. HS2188]MCT4469605.1 hypothetical protein [Mycoplasma sp. HS2188]